MYLLSEKAEETDKGRQNEPTALCKGGLTEVWLRDVPGLNRWRSDNSRVRWW